MKAFPWRCMHCREREVHPAALDWYATEGWHEGRKVRVILGDFHVLKCRKCGESALDDAANRRITAAIQFFGGFQKSLENKAIRAYG